MEPPRSPHAGGVGLKLALLGLIPLVVLLIGPLKVGTDGADQIGKLSTFQNSVAISVAAGELRARLHAEQALSAMYVDTTGGPPEADALADAREARSSAQATFSTLVDASGPSATPHVRELGRAAERDSLAAVRRRVDEKSIAPAEVVARFDARIDRLELLTDSLDQEIPIPRLINDTLAYSAISAVIGPAWEERRRTSAALVAGTFADPAAGGDLRDDLQELIATQKTFAGEFARLARGRPKATFAVVNRRPAMVEVDQIRARALDPSGGVGDVPVKSWMAASVSRIGDFVAVQELQGAHLREQVDREITTARRDLVLGIALLTLALIVLMIGSVLLARSITRPLGRIASAARRVASGRVPGELPEPTRDEIGDVTAAFRGLNETIDLMSAESARVLAAVQAGDKSARADESAFTGFWAAMPEGLNRILDEFGALDTQLESEVRRQRLLAEASVLALDVESGPALYSRLAALVCDGLDAERAALLSATEPGGAEGEVLGAAGRGWPRDALSPDERWQERAYTPGAVSVASLTGCDEAVVAHVYMGDGSDAYLYAERDNAAFSREEIAFLSTAAGLLAHAEARTGAEERLRRQSIKDEMTGLPNRAFFEEYLRQLEPLPGERPLHAIILLDIDRFQQVNETLGYTVGDELLREASRRLSEAIPRSALIARHGSDEFIVHVDGVAGSSEPRRIATALIACFEESIWADGNSIRLAASVGFAEGSSLDAASGRLTSNADTALRRAKGQPGSAVERFQLGHHAEVVRRSWLEGALWEHVNSAEMDVHFQPIVEAPGGRVVAVEALARWPGREDVGPTEFIPLAEEIGLIGRLDAIVRAKAVRWAAGISGPGAPDISFNLSPSHLADPDLARSIKSLIDESGIDPGRISLEITESAVVAEEDATLAALEALRALGVKLVIDDFGTGYSSFAYLTRLPLDGLKIDRAFIADAESPDQLTVLSSIISLCGELGLTVTAEGVESERQRVRLSQMGCDRIQGFLIAHPAAEGELDLGDRAPVAAAG